MIHRKNIVRNILGTTVFCLWAMVIFADPANPNYFDLGVRSFNAQKIEEAVTHFEKEIALHPENIDAYFNLGNCYFSLGKYGKCIWSYEKVLKKNPRDAEALTNIDLAYKKLNNGEKRWDQTSPFVKLILSIGTFVLTIISIASSLGLSFGIFLLMRFKTKKSTAKVIVISSSTLLVITLFSGFQVRQYENQHNTAIVVDPRSSSANLKPSTTQQNTIAEGTKVSILKDNGERVEVLLPSGKKTDLDKDQINVI